MNYLPHYLARLTKLRVDARNGTRGTAELRGPLLEVSQIGIGRKLEANAPDYAPSKK